VAKAIEGSICYGYHNSNVLDYQRKETLGFSIMKTLKWQIVWLLSRKSFPWLSIGQSLVRFHRWKYGLAV
jgi:hypothetical protein